MIRAALALVVAATLAACGNDPSGGSGDGGNGGADLAQLPDPPDLAHPPLGQPFSAPKGTWTWIDVAGTQCDDGSPTGIGVNAGDSDNLLVFHNGGGACWDFNTCFVLNSATHGPFGQLQFSTVSSAFGATYFFNRANAQNPFRDWTWVFVPYCTGDVHAGNRVATYTSGAISKTFAHVGRANVEAFLPRLAATFPSPTKLLVTGSSAGGYGALIDYDLYRAYWPAAKGYLLDDSGPFFERDAVSPTLREAWYTNWGLGATFDPTCPDCRTDLSRANALRAATYPGDRMGLLSSQQDAVIRGFLGLSPTDFQTDLEQMATDVLAPTANFKYFFIAGSTHTMLGSPAPQTILSAGGTDLLTWVTRFISDDAAWASVTP